MKNSRSILSITHVHLYGKKNLRGMLEEADCQNPINNEHTAWLKKLKSRYNVSH